MNDRVVPFSQNMHCINNMIGGNANMNMAPGYGMPNAHGNVGCEEQKKQDLGDILQQIMAISDQSLDEAQAR